MRPGLRLPLLLGEADSGISHHLLPSALNVLCKVASLSTLDVFWAPPGLAPCRNDGNTPGFGQGGCRENPFSGFGVGGQSGKWVYVLRCIFLGTGRWAALAAD